MAKQTGIIKLKGTIGGTFFSSIVNIGIEDLVTTVVLTFGRGFGQFYCLDVIQIYY